MPNVIYGLDQQGYALYNDVIRYCQATDQPQTIETYKGIYHEVLSQVVSHLHPDFQQYMHNLMTLPVWSTINYTGQPIDYDLVSFFRDSVRATGILLWNIISRKTGISAEHFYCLEGSDMTYILVGVYVNADRL